MTLKNERKCEKFWESRSDGMWQKSQRCDDRHQEDGEFKASLGYRGGGFKKNNKTKQKPQDTQKKAQLFSLSLEMKMLPW